jgi:sialate O-acetylesterase
MRNKFFFTLFCFLLLIPSFVFAQLRLPSFFSDHMVLQQKSQVKIWGWCNMTHMVSLKASWLDQAVEVKADGNSKWEVMIETPGTGGPYEILITDKNTRDSIRVKDVLIGEVWICSGQSNMVWNALNKHEEMMEELPNAGNPNIRLLNVERVSAAHPQENMYSSWTTCNAETVKSFSSIGYFAAKKLWQTLHVPVGIISSCWGGTAAEVWLPANVVESSPLLTQNAGKVHPFPSRPHLTGSLWNSMIHPLVGYKIAGVYWYQGESNVPAWQGYELLFSSLIQSWRNAWGEQLPFFYVQIAPYRYKSKQEMQAAFLREQQTRALGMPRTGMVVTTDLVPDITNIHPSKKIDVANRLADLSLVEVYGKNKSDYKSPVYDKFEIKDDKIIIHFKYLEKGLFVKGNEITEILIAGSDGNFREAKAVIKGNTIIVSSKDVKKPEAVRFGFTDTAMPNLFNTNGLPVSPFRTDDWIQ